MSYRFTDTDKWQDGWFVKLKSTEKLLFIYLCDNCDIAGFIEINIKKWVVDTGYNKQQVEGALKGLSRGLIYSKTGDCLFIINFLKHQKNLPINEKNQAHKGIIKRFNKYSHKFEINNIDDFIEGAQKGLSRGYGIGNGIGKVLKVDKITISKDDLIENNIELYKKWQSESENDNYRFFVDYILKLNHTGEPLKYCLQLKGQINEQSFNRLYGIMKKNGTKMTDKIIKLEERLLATNGKSAKDLNLTLGNWLQNKFTK